MDGYSNNHQTCLQNKSQLFDITEQRHASESPVGRREVHGLQVYWSYVSGISALWFPVYGAFIEVRILSARGINGV